MRESADQDGHDEIVQQCASWLKESGYGDANTSGTKPGLTVFFEKIYHYLELKRNT